MQLWGDKLNVGRSSVIASVEGGFDSHICKVDKTKEFQFNYNSLQYQQCSFVNILYIKQDF